MRGGEMFILIQSLIFWTKQRADDGRGGETGQKTEENGQSQKGGTATC